MANSEKNLTLATKCKHCNNVAPMEVVATYSEVKTHEDERTSHRWEAGGVYDLLLCPSCEKILLQYYFWHEDMDPEEVTVKILYPINTELPVGLPNEIQKAYEAALAVRNISPNAYAVLVGRVLELVCKDRKATGKDLYKRLNDLADKNEIPKNLVTVAHGLRDMRNIGAHSDLGELTVEEVPLLDDLCTAILEYVYSAPHLAKQAEKRLTELKKASSKGSATI